MALIYKATIFYLHMEVIIMSNKKLYKPGTKAPASGQYSPCNNNGKVCNTTKEITAVKGKTLPPTQKSGQSYILVDGTKNKSGKVK